MPCASGSHTYGSTPDSTSTTQYCPRGSSPGSLNRDMSMDGRFNVIYPSLILCSSSSALPLTSSFPRYHCVCVWLSHLILQGWPSLPHCQRSPEERNDCRGSETVHSCPGTQRRKLMLVMKIRDRVMMGTHQPHWPSTHEHSINIPLRSNEWSSLGRHGLNHAIFKLGLPFNLCYTPEASWLYLARLWWYQVLCTTVPSSCFKWCLQDHVLLWWQIHTDSKSEIITSQHCCRL